MTNDEVTSIEVGEGVSRRTIAVRCRAGAKPGLIWLGGFKSDMKGTKAGSARYLGERARACLHSFRLFGTRRVERKIFRWHDRTMARRKL